MTTQQKKTVPVAVIGLGAVMPDANDFTSFWQNIRQGRNSIREVPPERWRIEDHYDPDRSAPDKSYCKIGAFVSGFEFNPLGYRIPPRVAASMDEVQKWAVDAAHQALVHAGYEDKDFDRSRTAVVIGNAMAGEMQYITNLRVYFPRYARALAATDAFRQLSTEVQQRIMEQFHQQMTRNLPPITEDSMPGELSNVIAGRVANVFGLRGPNYTADAACASSLAALESALGGLAEQRYDMALTGGVDSSMAPHSFVKFCKIGAHAFIGGCSAVARDVPPYCMAVGNRAKLVGLNLVGLKRAGYDSAFLEVLKTAYNLLFLSELNMKEAMARVRQELPDLPEIQNLLCFIEPRNEV